MPETPPGGVVVIADDQEPRTLNPYAPEGDNLVTSTIGQAHLAGAHDIDAETLELIPELAVELPTVANGGVIVNDDGTMTVKWEIRDEAVWSDGAPITGRDFAFTLEYREAMNECWDEDADWKPVFAAPGDVATVGDKSVAVRFPSPTLEYEQLFQWIVPEHVVAGTNYCEDWNDTAWPAAGPFVVDDWQRGRSLTLVRNESYWKHDPDGGDRLPYLDGVEFRFIPETQEIMNAFRGREVDVIQPPPFPETIDSLEGLRDEGAEVLIVSGPVWEHLNFQFGPNNRNQESLNRYAEYRQAIAYALDLEQLFTNIGYEEVEASYGFITHFTPAATSEPWRQYEYNPDLARQLLAAACERAQRDCVASPPVMVFSTTSNADFRPRFADGLQEMLGEVGIEVRLELEDSQLFFGDTLNGGTFDVAEWAWIGSPGLDGLVSAFDVFDPDTSVPEGDNYYRWGTADSVVRDHDAVAEMRVLLAAIRSTVDRAEIMALAGQIEEVLAREAVVIPTHSRLMMGAVWADEIAGFSMNVTQASHTWNIEFWRRLDR